MWLPDTPQDHDNRMIEVGKAEAAEQIEDLKHQLWLLLGDVKARAVSCTCHPPLTKEERYHIERSDALLSGYEPND